MKECKECGVELVADENWYASHVKKNDCICIPCVKAYWRQYYKEHRAELAARSRRWREANPEKDRERQRRWHKDNPEKSRANRHRRRARMANAAINDFTAADWRVVLAYYNHRCAYCGKAEEALVQEHIIPISRDGNNTISNIVPACKACNDKKHTSTPAEAGMYLWKLPLTRNKKAMVNGLLGARR